MKILTNNLSLKILAFICAIFVWSYVYITESRTVKLPFSIPIEVRGLDQSLTTVINPNQTSVYLSVTADHNAWQNLSEKNFIAYIDLTGVSEGTYEVDVKAASKNSSMTINTITPSKITVFVEKASTKEVPIQVKTEGDPSDGLVVSGTKPDPETATIKGPQSYLDKITTAQAIVKVEGESATISRTVSLKAIDSDGKEINNVSINPQDATVEVQIGKGGQAKILSITPQFIGKPATGKWLASYVVVPSSVRVIITGDVGDIKDISTQSINIDGLTTDKEFNVKLKNTEGVNLVDEDTTVKVSIQIQSVNTSKEQILGMRYSGLTNLKIQSITPNTITGIISGSSEILSGLNSDNSYISLDLSTFKTPGTYSIDILNSMIKLPSGATLVNFAPSAITVTLDNK